MHLPLPSRRISGRVFRVGRNALLGALALVAWGVPGAAAADAPDRFEQLRDQTSRVASVAYRLASSNRQSCRDRLMPQAGFVLHDRAQYGAADRNGAATAYGLGSQVGVMAVVAGTPAAAAGLRADDQILSVNGRALISRATDAGPTTAFSDHARQIVTDELRKGALTLSVTTAGIPRTVRFTAELGCPATVQLVPAGAVNAWADGTQVMVTDAMVAQCATDDELALVIAHELAHNLLHHRARLARAGIANSLMLPVSTAGLLVVRQTEEEADRAAVRLVGAAGYDLSRSVPFMAHLLDANGLSDGAASTHPQAARRLALLRAAITSNALQRTAS